MLLSTSTSATADYNWQGAGTGGNTATDPADPTTQWGNAANWEEGSVPDAGDSARLSFSNAGRVYAQSAELEFLRIAGDTEEALLYIGEGANFSAARTYVGYFTTGAMLQSGGIAAGAGALPVVYGGVGRFTHEDDR